MNQELYSPHAARKFADKYKEIKSEKQFDQSFWKDFFSEVCGISDTVSMGIEFQYPVRSKETGTIKFVDALWPSVMLIEHKSAGESLDKAYVQATEYWISLDPKFRTPYIVLSDFRKIRIIEVETDEKLEFELEDLPNNLERFKLIIEQNMSAANRQQAEADSKAANLMAALFNKFEDAGYTGHHTSVFLVRILFLMFGDDTRMWKKTQLGLFGEIVQNSSENGQGLGTAVQELFNVLNTPTNQRLDTIHESLKYFPYVNGGIFSEELPIFNFTREMRSALLDACNYSWADINPTIFGALFQAVRDKDTRRKMGEHYTSESNILKAINDLFLNDFNEQLKKHWDSSNSLKKFQRSLADYVWLDAAAGSGNFLCVSYKKMRELELKCVARIQELDNTQYDLNIEGAYGLTIHLNQFTGIEIDEWSASIARVAMWLTDHQANLALEQVNGTTPNRFPLVESANIVHGNALKIDWASVIDCTKIVYIIGNPPFLGYSLQSKEQKEDSQRIWSGVKGSGILDYVANWHLLAARLLSTCRGKAALVSTNSITQGEQPPILWEELYSLGIEIDFAYRTFPWSNDAAGEAAVHVVILGFSNDLSKREKSLWTYQKSSGHFERSQCKNINAYLLQAPNILIKSRSRPLGSWIQPMEKGNIPADGGFLADISPEERSQIESTDPIASKYLRRIVGARELIHDIERYCLWLTGATPTDLRESSELRSRIKSVREMRLASTKATTVQDANRAHEFQEIRQPKSDYLAVPVHSSEHRDYVPMKIFPPEVIATNAIGVIPGVTLYTFGIMTSTVFTAWIKAVSGRIKSDIRVTNTSYNNFPFPYPSPEILSKVEAAAQEVLNVRLKYAEYNLATLYDPLSMPTELSKAHRSLDQVVLQIFGLAASSSQEDVLACLFNKYLSQLSDL
jgi:hypothetical protein